ncbi:MAG: alpha/beta hydrolase [Merismopedia sp. SIO2A8]|nr:alpha/beta hydrolase [Merismopedia sp. SIO2A8]
MSFFQYVEVKGEGPPLLCLHGHPGSSYAMSVFTHPLSQQFRTITPDLRGYGKSRTRSPFTMTDHLDDLDQVLEKYQVNQCMILGWSLGGILAMEMALRWPDRITGLILIGTAAHPRSSHPPISWQDNLYTGVAALINWAKPAWPWNIETFGKRSLLRYLFYHHNDAGYQRLATEGITAYLQASKYATQALYGAMRQRYNRVEDIKQIHCPCLVLAGESDRHITAEASEETAKALPNAAYKCYTDVAHLFPWEIEDDMMTDIQNWLLHQTSIDKTGDDLSHLH